MGVRADSPAQLQDVRGGDSAAPGFPTHRLVDKFHAENTYLICLCGRKLAGMLRCGEPPLLAGPEAGAAGFVSAGGRRICEIRLLAVEKKFRGAQVLQGILALLWQHGIEKGYDWPSFRAPRASLNCTSTWGLCPSAQEWAAARRSFSRCTSRWKRSKRRRGVLALVALARVPAQRGELFAGAGAVRARCGGLRAGSGVASGGCLREGLPGDQTGPRRTGPRPERRAVSWLGHFGQRCDCRPTLAGAKAGLCSATGVRRAAWWTTRAVALACEAVESPWGQPLDLAAVRDRLESAPVPGWLWCAHCETSTGVLNDWRRLKPCAPNSREALPGLYQLDRHDAVDLRGVWLASCASGKGLRSYPGLSMVFYHHELGPALSPATVSRLGHYAVSDGVTFHLSSNLLHALRQPFGGCAGERFAGLVALSAWLRTSLHELGFTLVGDGIRTSPAVVTIALPES